MSGKDGLTYADAGVDIEAANKMIPKIKQIAKKTHIKGAGRIGSFGAAFELLAVDILKMKKPVLVSSTDGVGTKLRAALEAQKHDTIGIDLVAMCVNDIIVQGAMPLFFLDYFATGKLDPRIALEVIKGIGKGCQLAGCALIGGETAEMPQSYPPGEYDLAGFTVGIVEKEKMIDGSRISVGNKLIGVSSNGLHSNGYSLVRKICFEVLKLQIDSYVEDLGCTLQEELLKPTTIYTQVVEKLLQQVEVNGMAHITGDGINNVSRILPSGLKAVLKRDSWDVPPIFPFLKLAGNVSDAEMSRTFNNGIGLVIVVPEKEVARVLHHLPMIGHSAYHIGEVKERTGDESQIEWVS